MEEKQCQIEDWKLRVFDWFRKFKLVNSVYTCQETLTCINADDKARAYCQRNLALRFGELVVKKDMIEESVEETQYGNVIIMKVELMVLRKSDFKAIVEGAISQLSDEQIKRIKEGHSIIST